MLALRDAWGTAALVASVACVGTPTQTYPGPPLPPEKVVVLRETSEGAILAIDGVEAWGSSWSVMPGPHELLVRFQIFTTAPNMNWTVWSYCWIALQTVAGERYVTVVRMRKEIAPRISEELNMEIGIADGDGILRGVPHSCVPKKPKLTD